MSFVLQVCNTLNNVGDRLAPIITKALYDVDVLEVFDTIPPGHEETPILAGLGSFLGYHGDWPLRVWGTGYEPGNLSRVARTYTGSRAQWKVSAVRGHVTRTILGLSEDVVIGDPCILLPSFYSPDAKHTKRERYFLHCDNDEHPDINDSLEVCSTRMDPFEAIDLIASSTFVFTEALHIAILAYAYDIPWAWCLNKHFRGMVKWYDWFSSIGVNGKCCSYDELEEGRRWFSDNHRSIVKLDMQALIDAFPDDVVSK